MKRFMSVLRKVLSVFCWLGVLGTIIRTMDSTSEQLPYHLFSVVLWSYWGYVLWRNDKRDIAINGFVYALLTVAIFVAEFIICGIIGTTISGLVADFNPELTGWVFAFLMSFCVLELPPSRLLPKKFFVDESSDQPSSSAEQTEDAMQYVDKCKVCKNREFDPSCGFVCGLTKEKLTCKEECPEFIADESQIELQKQVKEYANVKELSGWTKFFLWVGIGFGATISVIFAFVNDVFAQGWLLATVNGIPLFLLVATAIYTIVAFYHKKSNAVALAKTYIAMIFLDLISCLAQSILVDDVILDQMGDFYFKHAIGSAIWCTIWFCYVQLSENIKDVFPVAKRSWKLFEKIVIAVFAIIYTFGVIVLTNPKLMVELDPYIIEVGFEEINSNCPMRIDSDNTLLKVEKEDSSIVYTVEMNNVKYGDVGPTFWPNVAEIDKLERLKGIIAENDPAADFLFMLDLNMVYRVYDVNSHFLYEVVITPDDYKTAKLNPQSLDNYVVDELDVILRVQNSLCPMRLNDYMSVLTIDKEQNAIVWKCKMQNASYEDFDPNVLANASAIDKPNILNALASEPNDSIEVIFNRGYNLVYRYFDCNMRYMYEIVITPVEYRIAKANK